MRGREGGRSLKEGKGINPASMFTKWCWKERCITRGQGNKEQHGVIDRCDLETISQGEVVEYIHFYGGCLCDKKRT